MPDEAAKSDAGARNRLSPWRITGWVCLAVVAVSVASCVILAAVRSSGLTRITVTAKDADAEPRDHILPLIKKKEALPDYHLFVTLHDGDRINLGTKPDTSAAAGLSWTLSDPVSLTDVASARLLDQDKALSDVIAEVQPIDEVVNDGNYRFEFHPQRSWSVGLQSFFRTPVGKAIAAAFFLAVLLMLMSVFCA